MGENSFKRCSGEELNLYNIQAIYTTQQQKKPKKQKTNKQKKNPI